MGGTDIEVNSSDGDPKTLETRREKFGFYRSAISAINKRFTNTNSKNHLTQLPQMLHGRPLLDLQMKTAIQRKIDVSIWIVFKPRYKVIL